MEFCGFSVDNSVLIPADDHKARESLSQYIARHPVSLKKLIYIPAKAKVLYKTKYNAYFGENIKLMTAVEFIVLLTVHIPAKRKHLIRYYGIYSSRSKGLSACGHAQAGKARKDGNLKKYGFGIKEAETHQEKAEKNPVETLSGKQAKSTWARLMVRQCSPQVQKVYEVDPLGCPKCGQKMKVAAVITAPGEISRIPDYLKRNKAPPFDTPVPELSRRTLKPHNYISYCTRNPGTIGIHGGYVYSIKCKEEVFQAFSPDSAVWLTKIVDSRPNLVYNVTIECLKADFGAKTVCIR